MNPTSTAIDVDPAHLHNHLLRLVPLQSTDFEKLYAVAADPLVWEQHPQKGRYKQDMFQTFFEGALQSGSAFVIVDAATGKAIDSSRYYDYNRAEKKLPLVILFWQKNIGAALTMVRSSA